MADRGTILIIGYGNTLRRDDGVGVHLASLIQMQNWPEVQVHTVPQLTPELCELVASCQIALFLDSSVAIAEGCQLEIVEPAAGDGFTSHGGDPRTLLAWCQWLHDHIPSAWSIHIAAQDFGVGEELSSTALAGAASALTKIRELVQNHLQISLPG